MSLKTKILGRLLFSKAEREILKSANRTSRKAERALFGYNKKTLIALFLAVCLCVSVASALIYTFKTVDMSFRLKVSYSLAVEDASNAAQIAIAFGEFDFSEKKTATNIDHLRNLSTEPILVRYVLTLPSGWSAQINKTIDVVWLPSESVSIAYGSTQYLRISLIAPSSGQSTPQIGSIAFNVVDA